MVLSLSNFISKKKKEKKNNNNNKTNIRITEEELCVTLFKKKYYPKIDSLSRTVNIYVYCIILYMDTSTYRVYLVKNSSENS